MKINKINILFSVLLFLLVSITSGTVYGKEKEGDKGKGLQKVTEKGTDAYRMQVNNINMPINNAGVLADVQIGSGTNSKGAVFDNQIFLFSGGFYLSGVDDQHRPWTNAVASASRIQDYVAGPVGKSNDPNAVLYIVSSNDAAFGKSWQDWKQAVALGANFYDGDGDGIYNPVDKNGNGKWDSNEDRPDLIGDLTVWCVYNDGIASSQRTFKDVTPKGIEIRQTVFGLNSKGPVGNLIFVRYELENKGNIQTLDSTYFSVWADPDLGTPTDDLVGCDTLLNAGYIYNNGADAIYGANPPCFLIDFFQGPSYYTGVATDTAYEVNGKYRGINKIPGYKNLGITSFVHYLNGDATIGDPETQYDARNYQHGKDKKGSPLNPCSWAKGKVTGVDCNLVNPNFWYSGDPITQIGWVNTDAKDQRIMLNTGPFKLEKGHPVSIVVAYVVGRSTVDAKTSITVAKDIDKKAQLLFDNNFPSPPPPPPVEYTVQTSPGFLDLNMVTDTSVKYKAVDSIQVISRHVQKLYVTQYKTNVKSASVSGIKNAQVVAEYSLNNKVKKIYGKNVSGGFDEVFTNSGTNLLDSALFSDAVKGRLKLRLKTDAFNSDGPFIKGKEYYFQITSVTLNDWAIKEKSSDSVYVDSTGTAIEEFDTSPLFTVVFNEDAYTPASDGSNAIQSGASSGTIKYLPVDQKSLTGDNYKVEFFKDTRNIGLYTPFWKLTNVTTNTVLIDSSKVYNFDSTDYSGKLIDGFLLRIKPLSAGYDDSKIYYSNTTQWFKDFDAARATGIFYVGTDIAQSTTNPIRGVSSKVVTADMLKDVKIKFGTTGKAYRFISGYKGTVATRKNFAVYAAGVTSTDAEYKKQQQGFVDVPFTAWAKDPVTRVEKQMAVAFIERAVVLGGTPDGEWNPKDSLLKSGELIVVLNKEYSNDSSTVYTGTNGNWADIFSGYTATGVTATDSAIAKSPWFNALYLVGLEQKDINTSFTAGDVLTIPVKVFPYTNNDVFTFTTKKKGALSTDESKDLFNRITVFPNPLFAYNPATSYSGGNTDEPFVTFSNLPTQVTIKIYTLSGTLVRTLNTSNKSVPTSIFLKWNLQNDNGLRVASGMYLATVDCPGYGQKVLKFAIIMPQKQIQKY